MRFLKKLRNLFRFLNWKNVSIGRKYLTAFILSAILFFIAGSVVYLHLSDAGEDIHTVERESLRANEMAQLELYSR